MSLPLLEGEPRCLLHPQLSSRTIPMTAWMIVLSIVKIFIFWRSPTLGYTVFVICRTVFVISVGCRAPSRSTSVRPRRSLISASRSPTCITSPSPIRPLSVPFDRIRSARSKTNDAASPVGKPKQNIDEYLQWSVFKLSAGMNGLRRPTFILNVK